MENEKGGALAVMGSPPFVVVLVNGVMYNKKVTYRKISNLDIA